MRLELLVQPKTGRDVASWHLATPGSRIESAVAPEADHSSPKRWPTDFLQRREIQDIRTAAPTAAKSTT
jgi:hypothetical protein